MSRSCCGKVTESPRRQKALARKRRLSPMSGYVGLVPLVFVTVLLLFDVSVNRLGAPWLGGFLSLCVLALLGLIGAGFVWGLLRRRRFFRRLEKRDFLVCPDCHYSLVAHAAGGRCPECGYAFTPESLLQDWRDVRTVLWTDLRE